MNNNSLTFCSAPRVLSIMDPKSNFEETLFDFSPQLNDADNWDGLDDEILDAFHGDFDQVLPLSTGQEILEDFSIATSDGLHLDGERNELGSAVPDRYCLAMPRASCPNHC